MFGTAPAPKVFTLSPDHLQVSINGRLLADVGGSETCYTVPTTGQPGMSHQIPWSIDDSVLPDPEARLENWLASD